MYILRFYGDKEKGQKSYIARIFGPRKLPSKYIRFINSRP